MPLSVRVLALNSHSVVGAAQLQLVRWTAHSQAMQQVWNLFFQPGLCGVLESPPFVVFLGDQVFLSPHLHGGYEHSAVRTLLPWWYHTRPTLERLYTQRR